MTDAASYQPPRPKPHYHDYTTHILRLYTAHESSADLRSRSDVKNWKSAHIVMLQVAPWERVALYSIFKSKDTLADSVYETAQILGVDQSRLWSLISTVSRQIAKERGLI